MSFRVEKATTNLILPRLSDFKFIFHCYVYQCFRHMQSKFFKCKKDLGLPKKHRMSYDLCILDKHYINLMVTPLNHCLTDLRFNNYNTQHSCCFHFCQQNCSHYECVAHCYHMIRVSTHVCNMGKWHSSFLITLCPTIMTKLSAYQTYAGNSSADSCY